MVEYISSKDFYEIRLASLLSNVDRDVIIELYQPLIGSISSILYLNLVKQARNQNTNETFMMSALLANMQLSPGQLLTARQYLEGVGLLKTYEKKNSGEGRSYIYILYAPKTPKDFFADILFKGLLVQSVGEKEANRLAEKYSINLSIPEEYKDITSSFVDVFSPDYDDPAFIKEFSQQMLGHKSTNVKIGFDYDRFFEFVEENSQIKRSVFIKKDMKEIERISALYGLDEGRMAFLVIDAYKPYENPHLNYNELIEKCRDSIKTPVGMTSKKRKIAKSSEISDSSVLSKKIKIMEKTASADYLELLQGGSKPSNGDLKTIDFLSRKYDFQSGIINVIIDYTLEKCNNVLNRDFADSVSASLAREGVETALDAMNYLSTSGKKKVKKIKEEEEEVIVKKETPKEVETIDDAEMAEILAKINKKIGGKK